MLLHRLIHAGARVVEEPIHFRERERGRTKLGAGSILEFFCTVWWLRLTSHRVSPQIRADGASRRAGQPRIVPSSCFGLGMHKFLASPIAIELSIVSNS